FVYVFYQAEGGIRDRNVTGVQTCALPISKKSRLKKVLKLQAGIAYENAKAHLSNVYKTLIDYFDDSTGFFVGHTEFLSPTVDFGVKIVDNGKIKVGDFVDVKFLTFDGADYQGEVYESSK